MNIIDLIIPITLGLLGCIVLVFLGWILVSLVIESIGSWQNLAKLKKLSSQITNVDELIKAGKPKEALALLKRSILLNITSSRTLINALKEHHQNILSRCLIIAEECGGKTENIANVEKLIIERAEIQALLIKTKDVYRNISTRRGKVGKELPQWGRTDFERRLADIKQELLRNSKELEKEFEKLFQGVVTTGQGNIVYH